MLKMMAHLILILCVTGQQHSDRPGSIANNVSIPDMDDLQGDTSVWRAFWTVEKVGFWVSVRFQERLLGEAVFAKKFSRDKA